MLLKFSKSYIDVSAPIIHHNCVCVGVCTGSARLCEGSVEYHTSGKDQWTAV